MHEINYKKIESKLKKINLKYTLAGLTITSILAIVSLILLYLFGWSISGLLRKVISIISMFSLFLWFIYIFFALPNALYSWAETHVRIPKGEYKLIKIYYYFSQIFQIIVVAAITIALLFGIFGSFFDLFKTIKEIVSN